MSTKTYATLVIRNAANECVHAADYATVAKARKIAKALQSTLGWMDLDFDITEFEVKSDVDEAIETVMRRVMASGLPATDAE